MKKIIISATDTGVGKTAACEWLCNHLSKQNDLKYIKPIQCGPGETIHGTQNSGDAENISQVSPNIEASTLFHLKTPASPHLAFEKEEMDISLEKILQKLTLAICSHKFNLIEGAGGILVPINREYLLIDLFQKIQIPLIIIIRPGLGTINHSLLTLKTLNNYNIPVLGFMSAPGDSPIFEDNIRTIEEFSKVPYLGQIPHLESPLFHNEDYFKSIWNKIEQQHKLIEA